MRTFLALFVGILLVATSRGEEFALKTANGAIKVKTNLTLDDKGHSHLVVTAINDTSLPIQRATLCVKSPAYKKGCLFTLWTKREWGVNEEINFDPADSSYRLTNTLHNVSLSDIQQTVPPQPPAPRQPTKFDPIRRVFVEEFGGNTGPTLRDHVIGMLANSGRFIAVEKADIADAVIRGRSDSQEQATKVISAGKDSTGGSAGAIFGTVIASGRSTSASTSVSERVVAETISLRLTLPSGEVIWAWDETKACVADLVKPEFSTITKARCAIQDLTALAEK